MLADQNTRALPALFGGLVSPKVKQEQEMTVIRGSTSPGGLFPPFYHLVTKRKQLSGVLESWHFVYWSLFLITSISNLYHSVSAFSITMRSRSVFLTLNSCHPVIITVRYRMSFSPTLCTACTQTHSVRLRWDTGVSWEKWQPSLW